MVRDHYNEAYYCSENYIDYHHREDKYNKLAKELYVYLLDRKLIDTNTTILDYGCAIGFLLCGLKKLGLKNISGYDISTFATAIAKSKGVNILDTPHGDYDIMFSLDVFEHMTDDEIITMFNYTSADTLVCRIPVAKGDDPNFYLEVSRADETHINCKNKEQWREFIYGLGYSIIIELELMHIYNSLGVYSFIALK